mmetsp:Transcript_6871/g.10778  ORF Transcript_6871/g.10778 Transcript_6871/m.10778 type:complete len:539 (+) Transcript_6871:260-1876(+)|eukprot:CAMPEP_0184658184 /NCGR_PEP_ID=MMETSP0308-20130426/23968_1 /TAXON_ID=38269 /ORGANISM="Gloeochaete witrockiana, Strain SAG 46.84" /LENGTH=538 /DNA_ID=CAMNT_0027096905 /DNA_START=217 /DNA_END=1833 /DNA_ORIENTATION=-
MFSDLTRLLCACHGDKRSFQRNDTDPKLRDKLNRALMDPSFQMKVRDMLANMKDEESDEDDWNEETGNNDTRQQILVPVPIRQNHNLPILISRNASFKGSSSNDVLEVNGEEVAVDELVPAPTIEEVIPSESSAAVVVETEVVKASTPRAPQTPRATQTPRAAPETPRTAPVTPRAVEPTVRAVAHVSPKAMLEKRKSMIDSSVQMSVESKVDALMTSYAEANKNNNNNHESALAPSYLVPDIDMEQPSYMPASSVVDLSAVVGPSLFNSTMRSSFKDPVLPMETFLHSLERKLAKIGFGKKNAVVVLLTCNEPSMNVFAQEVKDLWKDPSKEKAMMYKITGPAVFTSASAEQLSRAATLFGVKKVIYMYMGHMALDDKGNFGSCTAGNNEVCEGCKVLQWLLQNPTMGKNSSAKESIRGNTVRQPPCSWDMINSLRKTLKPSLVPTETFTPNLPELTTRALRHITTEATRSIPAMAESKGFEYVICGGVLIHGPRGQDYVHPVTFSGSAPKAAAGKAAPGPKLTFAAVPTREQLYGG